MPLRHAFCVALTSAVFLASAAAAPTHAAENLPKFQAHVLNPNAGNVCYAVTLADVDGDKRTDIVVVTENRVIWFQNPDWRERVIIENQTERDNVCIAPLDIDGDGQVDFALGAGWTKIGTLQWLSRSASLDEKWQVHPLAPPEAWLHRMRFGDVLGTGRPQLVISPLNKTVAPEGVRLTAYEIPANPRKDAWRATVLDATLNAMHAHWMGDFDGNGSTDILTASQEGVFLFSRAIDKQGADKQIVKQQLGTGASDPEKPTGRGAGEIRVGRLKGGGRFIATVEPMHGNAIAVYTEPAAGEKLWKRQVLDDTLKRGHAVGIADVDRDGTDELIIGHSDPATGPITGPGVYIYDPADSTASRWTKHVVDNGGIATEDLVAEDLNGDGWPDIVACGRATHNVKLYINQGAVKP